MEILYIGLGIVSSIIIFLLGYSANGVFNGKKQITELRERFHTLDMNLGNIEEHIHIRIHSDYNELQSNIDEVVSKFTSHERAFQKKCKKGCE